LCPAARQQAREAEFLSVCDGNRGQKGRILSPIAAPPHILSGVNDNHKRNALYADRQHAPHPQGGRLNDPLAAPSGQLAGNGAR